MKYPDLRAPLFKGIKNVIRMDQALADMPVREKVATELYNLLTVDWDSTKKEHVQKVFPTLEDQKKLQKFKEKVVFSEGDIVPMGNDIWDFIKANFKAEHFPAQSNDAIIALADMVEKCDKQDEEKAEKEWKENAEKQTSFKEYYESLGYKVEITEAK